MGKVKSRREEYADATKKALLQEARTLFAEKGYAAVSLDEIAGAARMTKGALYHHFKGKQDLFAAVYEETCGALMADVVASLEAPATSWQRALTGLSRYLEGCADPTIRRITLEDAPLVFGWARWRELDEEHAAGILTDVLRALMEAGELETLPVVPLSRVLHGALLQAAMLIADAPDAARAKREVEEVLVRLLEGLRPRR